MSIVPENLKYTKDHEWIEFDEDGSATVLLNCLRSVLLLRKGTLLGL